MDMIKKAIADKMHASYNDVKTQLIKYMSDNDASIAADLAKSDGTDDVLITTDMCTSPILKLLKFPGGDDIMDEVMLSIKREHGINICATICDWESNPEEHNKVQILFSFGSTPVI